MRWQPQALHSFRDIFVVFFQTDLLCLLISIGKVNHLDVSDCLIPDFGFSFKGLTPIHLDHPQRNHDPIEGDATSYQARTIQRVFGAPSL